LRGRLEADLLSYNKWEYAVGHAHRSRCLTRQA
jgi:hypothetical protein